MQKKKNTFKDMITFKRATVVEAANLKNSIWVTNGNRRFVGMQKTHKQCPFKTGTYCVGDNFYFTQTNTRSFPEFLLFTLLNLH